MAGEDDVGDLQGGGSGGDLPAEVAVVAGHYVTACAWPRWSGVVVGAGDVAAEVGVAAADRGEAEHQILNLVL